MIEGRAADKSDNTKERDCHSFLLKIFQKQRVITEQFFSGEVPSDTWFWEKLQKLFYPKKKSWTKIRTQLDTLEKICNTAFMDSVCFICYFIGKLRVRILNTALSRDCKAVKPLHTVWSWITKIIYQDSCLDMVKTVSYFMIIVSCSLKHTRWDCWYNLEGQVALEAW